MRHRAFLIVLGALVAAAGTLGAQGGAPPSGLHVYGPGGPLEPMKECAAQFSQHTKVPVSVVGGPEKRVDRGGPA